MCFCIIASCVTSYASEGSEATEVKEKISVVKSRIGNTDEYSDFKSNVINYNNGTCAYNFSWCKRCIFK